MHGKLNRQLVGLLVHEIFSFLFLLSQAGNIRLGISKEKVLVLLSKLPSFNLITSKLILKHNHVT